MRYLSSDLKIWRLLCVLGLHLYLGLPGEYVFLEYFVVLNFFFFYFHDTFFEEDGQQLRLRMVKVEFRRQPLRLYNYEVVEMCSHVGVVRRTQVYFLRVDHDQNLP
jgi:hypothetical protein